MKKRVNFIIQNESKKYKKYDEYDLTKKKIGF